MHSRHDAGATSRGFRGSRPAMAQSNPKAWSRGRPSRCDGLADDLRAACASSIAAGDRCGRRHLMSRRRGEGSAERTGTGLIGAAKAIAVAVAQCPDLTGTPAPPRTWTPSHMAGIGPAGKTSRLRAYENFTQRGAALSRGSRLLQEGEAGRLRRRGDGWRTGGFFFGSLPSMDFRRGLSYKPSRRARHPAVIEGVRQLRGGEAERPSVRAPRSAVANGTGDSAFRPRQPWC